ncbi:hypothetical protein STEG23_032828, partial [Scotinomys teguina]
MEMKAAAPHCQLLLIVLMPVVMLLPGTKGLLLPVQITVTRTIVLQETIGKGQFGKVCQDMRSKFRNKLFISSWFLKPDYEGSEEHRYQSIKYEKYEYMVITDGGICMLEQCWQGTEEDVMSPGARASSREHAKRQESCGRHYSGADSTQLEEIKSHRVLQLSDAATWDKQFTAACSENSHQDHRVTRNHRQSIPTSDYPENPMQSVKGDEAMKHTYPVEAPINHDNYKYGEVSIKM